MMAQWQECKTAAKDALLLFRLGDFYEAFHDDAKLISKELGLTLSAADVGTGVDQVMVSNTGDFASSTWGVYQPGLGWTLPTGDGTKTVYVKFRDRAGNVSPVYSDTIMLETVAPTGSITINNGDSYVASTNVTVTLAAFDAGSGVTQMMVSNSSNFAGAAWAAFAASRTRPPSRRGTWRRAEDAESTTGSPQGYGCVFF